MRPSPQLLTLGISFAISFMACGIALPLYAATPSPASPEQVTPCDNNLSIDPTLRLCVRRQDGMIHYQLKDLANNSQLELTASKDAIRVQRTGPDGATVVLDDPVSRSQGASLSQGIVTPVYQDQLLLIGKELPGDPKTSTWVIQPTISRSAPVFICTKAGCSGGIH